MFKENEYILKVKGSLKNFRVWYGNNKGETFSSYSEIAETGSFLGWLNVRAVASTPTIGNNHDLLI